MYRSVMRNSIYRGAVRPSAGRNVKITLVAVTVALCASAGLSSDHAAPSTRPNMNAAGAAVCSEVEAPVGRNVFNGRFLNGMRDCDGSGFECSRNGDFRD